MSKEVKRHLVTAGSECSEMVYASDYDALHAEWDRLRETLVTARDWIDFSKGAVGGGTTILEEIDAALQGQQP